MTREEAIKRLQEHMIIHEKKEPRAIYITKALQMAIKALEQQPKTGHWINIQFFKADSTYYRPKCPFCSIEPEFYSNFCPNCGARMVESEG
ncbi:MAG: hypothetical protein K6F17_05510 [Lachnospiraceae bacterium]|nr:hypothetical protein [Lachnospiraceae bacterium]